jgi:glycosyltransferase involved in cell wall biosynthesis
MITALRFRADAVIVSSGTCHWFPLVVFRWFGGKVIPSLHCVLWRKNHPPSGLNQFIQSLDGRCFIRSASILSASQDITHQVEELTACRQAPIVEFLPTYRSGAFDGDLPPPEPQRPFRVLYAGRIERDKGVFDLLAIARQFAAAGRTDIEFDLCGTGSHLEELRQQSEAEGLLDRFRCHGHGDRSVMRTMFAKAHVVIVPTTSAFVEGFNQVVAEGVLSGRPVITSSVCPALEYVRDAVVEVPVDDVAAYGDAILRLCDEEAFYQARCRGCRDAQAQFYDVSRSWGAAVKRVLTSLFEGRVG